jgi:hypothetical protein
MIGTATKNTIGLWCKKLIIRALKGSFMIWVKAKPETLACNKIIKEKPKEEEADEEERKIAERIIEDIDEELKLGNIYENEGDAERKNLIQELVMEKERMNELNLPEEAINEEMREEEFLIYKNKVMKQEDVADYKEVSEVEEKHYIEKPNLSNEIVINTKPNEHPLDPEAEDNNLGGKQS